MARISPQSLLGTARALHVDATTLEVTRAFGEQSIECILLKGPTFARWLYADGTPRPYNDSDLLVAETASTRAFETLSRLGFRFGGQLTRPDDSAPGSAWRRGDDHVDLHFTLVGAGAPAARVWEVLSRHTCEEPLAGGTVTALAVPAKSMHVATHVAQHGPRIPKPVADLARALELVDDRCWSEAAAIARDIDALPAFVSGLRTVPSGTAVLERLGIASRTDPATRLRASGAPPLAVGFEQLHETHGLRPKLRRLAREAVPSRNFMRIWSPTARRGHAGLALAYVTRLLWLARKGPAAYAAYRRARKPE
jgi:hypothetical protein